jgi:CYTH domain-containing protein
MKEIERKFLAKKIPNLDKFVPIKYERHFLEINNIYEKRIQKKGSNYELEKKTKINEYEFKKDKTKISKEEYDKLKKDSIKSLIRISYIISNNPEISLKIYQNQYEGLNRIEVEFDSINDLNSYKIPDWFGKEITNTQLGNDSKLVQIDKSKFLKLLSKYS